MSVPSCITITGLTLKEILVTSKKSHWEKPKTVRVILKIDQGRRKQL